MCVKPTHNGWWRRIWTSFMCLVSDAEQVRDEIAIYKMRGVNGEYGDIIPHIKAWTGF